MKDWIISLISGLCGAMVGAVVSVYITHEQLDFSYKIETLKLARELTQQFYQGNDIYKEIRVSVDKCETLYKNWGGKYTYDQINQYLGFFDDIGFYEKNKILDNKIIDQLFGAHILEAYEKAELRKYIDDLRRNNNQPQAFEEFDALAKKLEEIPERKELVENIRRKPCPMK